MTGYLGQATVACSISQENATVTHKPYPHPRRQQMALILPNIRFLFRVGDVKGEARQGKAISYEELTIYKCWHFITNLQIPQIWEGYWEQAVVNK